MLKVILTYISLVWYLIVWTVGIIGCIAARKRYRSRPQSPLASAYAFSVPGVSILRPLKGLDTNLYENLESTFTQEYPNYEIFLCVDDEEDQALSVVRDLLAKYPHVNAHIAIGHGLSVGVNPKVNNLMTGYRQTSHDILWVLDSNVMVDRGALARAVEILAPPSPPSSTSPRRIGVVHHVPYAWVTTHTLGSCIEQAFLNTNHAKMYVAINTVAVDSCVVGKSCLYRKSDLERVNGSRKPIPDAATGGCQPGERGLEVFGRFLAEDNQIAGALWHELGLRHDLSRDVAINVVGDMSVRDYVARRVRWVRVRKRLTLPATLAEPFTESILAGLLTSISLRNLAAIPPWIFLPAHFLIWLLVDMDVFASLAGHPIPPEKRWEFVAAWAMRETLALPIWVAAIVGDTVEWRGERYRLIQNGEVEKVSDSPSGGVLGCFRGLSTQNAMQYESLDTTE